MLTWWRRKGRADERREVVVASRRQHPRLPPGERIYAVGDVHGRLDLLRELEQGIADDLAAQPLAGSVTVVYLGDYVDRGPDSRRVLDLLANQPPAPIQRRYLLGNHDWWLREFVQGADPARPWLQSGGDTTLRSYGVSSLPRLGDPASLDLARRQLLRRMPPAHTRFLGDLLPMYRQGEYLFAHAGIRPGIALEAQEIQDLVQIREPFLSAAADFGAVVVHGHSIVEHPDVRDNRIGVDTGAYWTGCLTAAVLETDDVRFIQTSGRA